MSQRVPSRFGRCLSSYALRTSLRFALIPLCPLIPSLALLSTPAEGADPVRYHRPAAKVATKNRLKTKVAAEKKRAAAEARGPSFDAEDLGARKREGVTLAVLADQISVARRLVDQADPASGEYAGYLFRLADLHLDEKAIYERQVGALYEKIAEHERGGEREAAKRERARQTRLSAQQKKAGQRAVQVLAKLVNDGRFAKFARRDEALYAMAFELGQLGQDGAMQKAYVRLLTEHPQSKFRPHVYVAFGDHKFEAGEIGDALQLYDKVVDGFVDSPLYAYALYKTAWCHLNPVGSGTPDYERSLDRFVKAIGATLQGRAGSEANARQLRREARRDLVRAFAHAGRPSRAWELFSKVGQGPAAEEDMARKMMDLLAGAYFGEGMYVESTAIYRELQDRFAGDPEVCEWQSRIVINALATDDADIQWKETQRLARTWEDVAASSHEKLVKRRCRAATRDTLAQMGTTWHDEASKTGREAPWTLAGAAYAEFLRLFPKDEEAYELAFYLAEVHWARAERLVGAKDRALQRTGLEAFRAAHDAFVRVLELKPKGKLTRDAAFGQMLAMKNHLEYDETGGQKVACVPQSDGTCVYRTARRERVAASERAIVDAASRFPPKPYGDAEAAMLQAYATYEQFVKTKDDPELPKILWHRAKIMMDHHRFDDVLPVLERLVVKFDGTRYAAWSAEMLLDVLTIRWADGANDPKATLAASARLKTWAEKLRDKKLYRLEEAAPIRDQVPRLLAAIGWREAEAHRIAAKEGDDPDGYVKCAERYVAIYEEHEQHDRGDELLFNAALCFEAAYRVGNAINVRKALLEHHPDSKLYKQTLREVAENYQAIAYYEDAAERLEQYASTYERDDYAGPALENAFLFRRGLGDDAKAREDLGRYEKVAGRKDAGKAAGIFWAEHDLQGDDAGRLAHAQAYIERYGKKGGHDRLAVAHAVAGQVLWRRSCAKGGEGDVCVTVKRERAGTGQKMRDQAADLRRRNGRKIPERCGAASHGVVVVHERDAKLAAQASKHLQAALEHGRKAGKVEDPDRRAALRDATAMATVYRADAQYEDYLRLQMPEGLQLHVESWKKDSGVAEWERQYRKQLAAFEASRARFEGFLGKKKALGTELIESYGRVKEIGSPHWILAAAARSAVLSQNFADQLYRAEVPGDIKTEEQYDAYCDALADYAIPLEEMAKSSFEYCLERSTEYSFFNEFSRMCEQEMQQREPDRFPATNEVFGRSIYTGSRMDRVPVQREIDGIATATTTPGARTRPRG